MRNYFLFIFVMVCFFGVVGADLSNKVDLEVYEGLEAEENVRVFVKFKESKNIQGIGILESK